MAASASQLISMKSSTGLFTCGHNAPLARDPLVSLRVSRAELAGIAVSPQSPLFSYCTSGSGRSYLVGSAICVNFRIVFGLSFLALLRLLDLTVAVLHRALSSYSKPNIVRACVSVYVCFFFCGHASMFGWGEEGGKGGGGVGDGRRGRMHHAHAPNTSEC